MINEDWSMFVKRAWYAAGWSNDFPAGELHARTIINEPIVLLREASGTLIAMQDRCPHRWAPLSKGRIENESIRCMYHGVRFGLDGRCVEVPGQEKAPSTLRVRTYPVIERHKWAWIWMGEADQADPSLLPDLSLMDREDAYLHFGQLDYAANYNLINDNLIDLSHVAFVHEKTIGRPVAPDGSPPAQVTGAGAEPLPRGVKNDNWTTGTSAFQPPGSPATDQWMEFSFLVPGIFINHFRNYPAGTAERLGFVRPPDDLECLTDAFSCQSVTPMTARTTRYLYAGGQRKTDMSWEDAQAIFRLADEAFREDTVMIESQQLMIDQHPGTRMGWINADRGLSLFRSVLERLITEEKTIRGEAPASAAA